MRLFPIHTRPTAAIICGSFSFTKSNSASGTSNIGLADRILESDGYLRWQTFVGYKYPTYGLLRFL